MKLPLSWIKDYVDLGDISVEELASVMTLAGLEVEEINYIGLPIPSEDEREFKSKGLAWDKEKIVVGEITEVNGHPDADRLTLCKLNDGKEDHIVLTGAPNLFPYKDQGVLDPPLKVAYAKEGAELVDAYADEYKTKILKRTKIRGTVTYSMVCSEKELGLSEEHEGIMLLDAEAPTGMPLADYLGDAVLDIAILPNIARDANVIGVAREIAALLNTELKQPSYDFVAELDAVSKYVELEIQTPENNPRFTLGLIKDVEIKPSPALVQRRLNMCGIRAINNIVDVTNYVMLEVGEPLHAFDYDVLVERAGGKTPKILTRTADVGEKLTTLDDVERTLEDYTTLVCDEKGSLSIAGIMGGAESEVSDSTKNVLLEAASWNFINLRKTLGYLKLNSEASYRFSRGVHPEMAPRGLKRGLELMREWSNGKICEGIVDEYPNKAEVVTVEVTTDDVERLLGVRLEADEIADLLQRLEFEVKVTGETIKATVPDHRLDIDTGVVGKADLVEEIARIYGYDKIPETLINDETPPQKNQTDLMHEDKVRDLLVNLGLYETITYRLSSEDLEAKAIAADAPRDTREGVYVANPLSPDREMMRRTLLPSIFETAELNAKYSDQIQLFEIGPVFLAQADELPNELYKLAIAMTGPRNDANWQAADTANVDFYDMKGVVDGLLTGMHVENVHYEVASHPSYHPGKCAKVLVGDVELGVFGEVHPQVNEHYAFGGAPLMAAELDMGALRDVTPERHVVKEISAYPPVLEDFAFVVEEDVPAGAVTEMLTQTAGQALAEIKLFDVFRGEQVGKGKKSLAYKLTYQMPDKTLSDKDVAKIRKKIVKRLEYELGAKLRA